jgi:hypothetical protein
MYTAYKIQCSDDSLFKYGNIYCLEHFVIDKSKVEHGASVPTSAFEVRTLKVFLLCLFYSEVSSRFY